MRNTRTIYDIMRNKSQAKAVCGPLYQTNYDLVFLQHELQQGKNCYRRDFRVIQPNSMCEVDLDLNSNKTIKHK